MYDSNKEATIEFVRGAGFVILVMGLFFGFILTLGEFDPKPAQKYEVVDEYKGCDVVRYNRQEEGRYTYFLDCPHYRD